ncbi:MAG: uroporphyrinogen-III C-methyltransferase [Betaproteobacteria bacterium]|nr:uroporphyrinogen-III C-methyltransferase [Betaproteobacteria bacterium]
MDFLPIFLDIREQPCLVVGGGEVAARKCALLLRAGARVTIQAPALGRAFDADLAAARIAHRASSFHDEDAAGYALVIAATNDDAVNRAVAVAARARHIPVNVVDQPALCSFIMPSIVERAPLIVAVSSGGASPVLARLLRARLESLVPAGYGRLAELAAAFRDRVKARFKPAERRRFWERALQGPIAELVFSGRDEEARKALQETLGDTRLAFSGGEVSLVGAGPGDPDLLTFRALRLMQQADVVVYDRLVSQPVLNLVRLEAERIYAGKERAKHALPQEDINHLLVRLAREGKRVVRLKGGDPFIFGRGGEEIDTLAAEGIPFQVVPGITAAAGCASYAGIPLTHRDYAQSVVFVTGHMQDGTMNLNWRSLAQPRQTVVFYMGLVGIEVLCRELTAHGLPAATPAALIQQGTTPQQRVLTGTLESLPAIVRESGVKAPTLIIIGEVVRLRERLKWFEPAA